MKDLLKTNCSIHFSKELPADPITENYIRKVDEACFSFADTKKPSKPEWVHLSTHLLQELNLEVNNKNKLLNVFSGAEKFNNFKSYAMCYGGHQFGSWAGQLGDGRAINIAEIYINKTNWKFQLKGSGPTPYSRGADGLAVLRSSVREYLCSEAMHYLGIPTTRALSIVKTGDMITRDILYNGNKKDEHGAIVCRISPSFIRFGSFEIFSSKRDLISLKKIVDYTINHHYAHLGKPSKETYLSFFKEVSLRTKDMIIHWQRVGFVHGVMNTDNMSILGLTIDYGPYGWLENYDPNWTPNTTDNQNKRYRFGNQANVGLWNLYQLANALYPLIDDEKALQDVLEDYKISFFKDYYIMMYAKLGLFDITGISKEFIKDLTKNLELAEIDMTIFYRNLSNEKNLKFKYFYALLEKSSYLDEKSIEKYRDFWEKWHKEYIQKIAAENISKYERQNKMNAINPKYVLRNYMAQLAIEAAEKGDNSIINELYDLLLNPYSEQTDKEKWFAKRPNWALNKIGCSQLSCSS